MLIPSFLLNSRSLDGVIGLAAQHELQNRFGSLWRRGFPELNLFEALTRDRVASLHVDPQFVLQIAGKLAGFMEFGPASPVGHLQAAQTWLLRAIIFKLMEDDFAVLEGLAVDDPVFRHERIITGASTEESVIAL